MEKVSIVVDGKTYEYEKGTTFKKIAADFRAQYDAQIAVCIFNGKIRVFSWIYRFLPQQ